MGLLVLEVVPGGSADRAGMRGGSRVETFGRFRIPLDGDIIIAVDGVSIEDFQDLTVYLETETLVGETVSVKVLRGGREQTFQVVLDARPQE
jgi:S1-C subfamily serine protease